METPLTLAGAAFLRSTPASDSESDSLSLSLSLSLLSLSEEDSSFLAALPLAFGAGLASASDSLSLLSELELSISSSLSLDGSGVGSFFDFFDFFLSSFSVTLAAFLAISLLLAFGASADLVTRPLFTAERGLASSLTAFLVLLSFAIASDLVNYYMNGQRCQVRVKRGTVPSVADPQRSPQSQQSIPTVTTCPDKQGQCAM